MVSAAIRWQGGHFHSSAAAPLLSVGTSGLPAIGNSGRLGLLVGVLKINQPKMLTEQSGYFLQVRQKKCLMSPCMRWLRLDPLEEIAEAHM